jgi:SAM-dependent methyltransferase
MIHQMSTYTGTDNLEVMAEAVNYNDFLFDLIEKHASRSRSALDFGAGIGTFAAEMRRRGLDIHCIEPDPNQRQILLRQNFRLYGDINDAPEGTYDYVYTLNVLEHIEDDEFVLAKLHSRMRGGGRLLVYVPAFQILYSSMDKKVGHVRRYRKHELTERLRRAGFEIVQARYCDSLGFFASIAFKLLGSASGAINVRALVAYDRFVFPASRLLDKFTDRMFGKNVVVVACKP